MEYARSHVGRFFARFHERLDKIIAYFDLIRGNPTESRDGPLETVYRASECLKVTARKCELPRLWIGGIGKKGGSNGAVAAASNHKNQRRNKRQGVE